MDALERRCARAAPRREAKIKDLLTRATGGLSLRRGEESLALWERVGVRGNSRWKTKRASAGATRDEARHDSDAARRRALSVICLNAPSLARSAVSLWVLLVADDFDDTVCAVYFVIGPGRPVQRVGLLRKNAVAKLHSPESIDVYGLVVCVAQSAEELALARPEGVDRAVAEIADQQCAAELSEARRRKRESPWRVENPVTCDSTDEVPLRIEDVDEAETWSLLLFVAAGLLLFRIRDVDVAANRLNAEGGVGRVSDSGVQMTKRAVHAEAARWL
jgi:hypothetical protein